MTIAARVLAYAEVNLMRWWYAWCVVLLLLLWANTPCFGQTVRIRVVNVSNGGPLTKQQITISGLYGKGSSSSNTPDLRLVTDANGEVQFELPKSAPAHFTVRADLNYGRWYCDCIAFVTTAEVIQKGFMTRPPDEEGTHTLPVAQLKPGDILFRARPTPWWVRVLYPLVKD